MNGVTKYWKIIIFTGACVWFFASQDSSMQHIKKDQQRILVIAEQNSIDIQAIRIELEKIRREGVDDRYRASDAKRDFNRMEVILDDMNGRISRLEAKIEG